MKITCSQCRHVFKVVKPRVVHFSGYNFTEMSPNENIVDGIKENGCFVFECPKCKEKNKVKTS